jgi:hypothetical protein
MLREPNELSSPESTEEGVPDALSRRGLGKRMLVRAGGLALLMVGLKKEDVQAATATTTWKLGGNGGVNTDGTNFLGTNNVAPLILKTTQVAGGKPAERLRVTPNGLVGVGTTTPAGKLHSKHNAAQPAIHGENASALAGATGVQGKLTASSPAADGAAVRGVISATTGSAAGVRGDNASSGPGVHGNASGGPGVQGVSVNNYGVSGTGPIGVYGQGGSYGLYGSGTSFAVYAVGGYYGAYGYGTSFGMYGYSPSGLGLYGYSAEGSGIKGEANGDAPNGVTGSASGTNVPYGVWGIASSSTGGSYAGYFDGNVSVKGTLYKAAGAFKIDHPLDPANKYLVHSFVESPDMMNVYNGIVTLDAGGSATVEMPNWFQALNTDFRYQLTTIGKFAPVYVANKMAGNRFTIAGGSAGMEVSWQVTGIRQDAFAKAHPLQVEQDKPGKEKGTYLHPEEHGKPESAGINAERIARSRAQSQRPQLPDGAPQPG